VASQNLDQKTGRQKKQVIEQGTSSGTTTVGLVARKEAVGIGEAGTHSNSKPVIAMAPKPEVGPACAIVPKKIPKTLLNAALMAQATSTVSQRVRA
jgi:hypothetical protein